MTDQTQTSNYPGDAADLDSIADERLVSVPAGALEALLAAWSSVTAHYGKDMVPPEGDDAFDVLNDYLADVLS
jgi:hypothetical protein